MNNKTYDILKYIGRYVLPALAVCVAKIFDIWGLNYGNEIASTIMAIDVLLNVILGVSSVKYNKENEIELEVQETFNEDAIEDLTNKKDFEIEGK